MLPSAFTEIEKDIRVNITECVPILQQLHSQGDGLTCGAFHAMHGLCIRCIHTAYMLQRCISVVHQNSCKIAQKYTFCVARVGVLSHTGMFTYDLDV